MYRKVKRIIDVVAATVLLVTFSPLMLLAAVAIVLDSGFPVIYRQQRLGRFGKPFTMYKFRGMCEGAETMGTGAYSFSGDPRITRVGRVLRKASIDELPQLVNIIKGDMSFIGPRPMLTYHPVRFEEYTDEERTVFSVRPGITGWAQVNGRNAVDWVRRFELNEWYVRHVSFFLDVKIVFKTILQVFSRKETVITEETAKAFQQLHRKQG